MPFKRHSCLPIELLLKAVTDVRAWNYIPDSIALLPKASSIGRTDKLAYETPNGGQYARWWNANTIEPGVTSCNISQIKDRREWAREHDFRRYAVKLLDASSSCRVGKPS